MIQLGWVKLVGAGYLLYLVYRHFGGAGGAEDRRTPPKAQGGGPQSVLGHGEGELTTSSSRSTRLVAVAMSPKR